jgi:hypothetical protein
VGNGPFSPVEVEPAAAQSIGTKTFEASCLRSKLSLYLQNRVLRGLGDAKFDNSLGWYFDLLLRLWIKAHARFLFCFTSLPKPGTTNSPFFLISL